MTMYEGIARELTAQIDRLRSFTGHAPSVGSHREELLRNLLRTMLSSRHALRTGFSFASQGVVSSQGDILIVDENYPAPYLFRAGDLVVVQPEAVRCVVEVKSKLDKRTFAEGVANLRSFKKVAMARSCYTATFLFAFTSAELTHERLDSWYRAIEGPNAILEHPDFVMVLDRGALMLVPEKPGRPQGHYPLDEPGPVKAQCLSIFVQTLRKWLEQSSGIARNPFEFAELGRTTVRHVAYRFGVGAEPAERL